MNLFADIHCHILPGIDDGAENWDESLAMARLMADDGIETVVATPHQLGNFETNHGDRIRGLVVELQQRLDAAEIRLQVLPGADVRIEAGMFERIRSGDVLTLGDHRKHVLLELPQELYLPLEPVLQGLASQNIVGILSHPEHNDGIMRQAAIAAHLVDCGCLMQVTAGSLCGSFGPECQQLASHLLSEGLVHFITTDGHGTRSRRPLMRRAFEKVAELTNETVAIELCSKNPASVAAGRAVAPGRRGATRRRRGWFTSKSVA